MAAQGRCPKHPRGLDHTCSNHAPATNILETEQLHVLPMNDVLGTKIPAGLLRVNPDDWGHR